MGKSQAEKYIMRDEIFDRIEDERGVQEEKWGTEFDDKNTPNDWSTYICQYATDAVKMKRKDDGSPDFEDPFDPEQYEKKLIQAATIAVAALEAFYRSGGKPPKRHYDV